MKVKKLFKKLGEKWAAFINELKYQLDIKGRKKEKEYFLRTITMQAKAIQEAREQMDAGFREVEAATDALMYEICMKYGEKAGNKISVHIPKVDDKHKVITRKIGERFYIQPVRGDGEK